MPASQLTAPRAAPTAPSVTASPVTAPTVTAPTVTAAGLRARASAAATRIDLHQHLLPPAFLDALRARTAVPMMRDEWTLLTEGESPHSLNPTAHDVERRRLQEQSEGKGEVLLSLPGNLRVEHLPFDDAQRLIDVWHRSALDLGDPFRVWAATPMTTFDLDGLAEILSHDRVVGLQLPASAMAEPADIRRLEPVLGLVEVFGKPVLVHPRHVVASPRAGVAATDSVPRAEQLKAAWLAWNEVGRAQHPDLRIAFIALAGLAPLARAAAQARGQKVPKADPNVFYETSAYDERAIDAMARVVGPSSLVHGSDRPFRHPRDHELGRALTHAVMSANPRALLGGAPTTGV